MAGLYFGKSRWDDIPQTLGLKLDEYNRLVGQWRGHKVEAYFTSHHDPNTDRYSHYTDIRLELDPPLGVFGLENDALFDRIVEHELRADIIKRTIALGLCDFGIGDGGMSARWYQYQSDVERYRAAFEIFAWAAQIVLDLRAKNPPQWELEIAKAWPPLAQGWGLQLDVRRGVMKGTVRGRNTTARVKNERGTLTTGVEVAVPLPAGCSLSLARQKAGDGFFDKLFRGQDVLLGDPTFDAAFLIKGEPETFVRAALSPAAQHQILTLAHAGCSITLKDGLLTTVTKNLLTSQEHLDNLMKAAYSAALALCPEQAPNAAQAPYR